jgi:hypothetical protein
MVTHGPGRRLAVMLQDCLIDLGVSGMGFADVLNI